MEAKIRIDRTRIISKIDNRVYGSFVEHLGRAVYTGIYEPAHPLSDEQGFRTDVLDAVKALSIPIVRYPGGNFVSGYRWEDGVGPREDRPQCLELSWKTIETNEVGVAEFRNWASRAGADVLMAANLGTRGPAEAGNLVEYCNLTTETKYARMRKAHGYPEPFGFKTWCLGNEMDGPWQICTKTATEYARVACEAAKIMKWTDPEIELVACGSSSKWMPTFGMWEETVLRECWDHIDYISLHNYFGNKDGDTALFLSRSLDMEDFIHEVSAICDRIRTEKKSEHNVYLSFDEWNVWYHSDGKDSHIPRWSIAPSQLEDIYNLEDALVVGCMLNALIRNADRVKIACMAQLVNVLAPIMTVPGGGVWLQTIFHPFFHASTMGRGTSLAVDVSAPTYAAGSRTDIPCLDTSAVISDDGTIVTVFAVNRSLEESMTLTVETLEGAGFELYEHIELTGDDLSVTNGPDRPDAVAPRNRAIAETIELSPRSWNVLRWKVR